MGARWDTGRQDAEGSEVDTGHAEGAALGYLGISIHSLPPSLNCAFHSGNNLKIERYIARKLSVWRVGTHPEFCVRRTRRQSQSHKEQASWSFTAPQKTFCAQIRNLGKAINRCGSKEKQKLSHPVDIHVGKRIRHRRLLLKTTQQELSNQVGVKFQQMQKYETGKNRVSASRLWSIAEVLNVPVSFFFDGLEDGRTTDPTRAHLPFDILNNKEALDLLGAYFAAPENQRRQLLELVRTLSEND